MSLTVKDLEKLNSLLSSQHLDYQMELVDGKIIFNIYRRYRKNVISLF